MIKKLGEVKFSKVHLETLVKSKSDYQLYPHRKMLRRNNLFFCSKGILFSVLMWATFFFYDNCLWAQEVLDDMEFFYDRESLRAFDIKKKYSGPVLALAFSDKDAKFFSSGSDPRLHCWEFYAGEEVAKIMPPEEKDPSASVFATTSLIYLKSGMVVSAGRDGLIHLWNPIKKQHIGTFAENERIEQVISFQTTAAAITGGGNNQGLTRAELKNIKSKEMIDKGKGGVGSNAFSESVSNNIRNRRPYINTLATSYDELYIAAGDAKGLISIWSVKKQVLIKNIFGHTKGVNVVAFQPKSYNFVSGGKDGKLIFWNWRDGNKHKSSVFPKQDAQGMINALAYNPSGKLLASGGDAGKIIIWEFREKDTAIFTLEGHKAAVTKLEFTKDGRYLVSSSEDNTIRIWDTQQMRVVHIYSAWLYPVNTFALSPSGYFILSAGNTDVASIRLWKLKAAIEEYEKQY